MRRMLILLGVVSCCLAGCGSGTPPAQAPKTEAWQRIAVLHPDQAPSIVEAETSHLRFDSAAAYSALGENWRAKNGPLTTAPDKVWGTGLELDLEVTILGKRHRTLVLLLQPHVLPDKEQITKVLFNGLPLGECIFDRTKGWDPQEFRMEIPESAQQVGPNRVTFLSRFALSATEAGRGNDDRKLAFWLHSVKLLDGAEPEPAEPDYARNYLEKGEAAFTVRAGARLHFPVELPEAEALEIRAAGNPALIAARDETAPAYRPIALSDGRADITAWQGQLVDIVLDAAAADQQAGSLEIWAVGARKKPEAEPHATPAPPTVDNVVFITLDALRADALGCYGYTRETSPAIDALAAQSLRFENCYASAPFTYSSVWSLMTGAHAFQHAAVVQKAVPAASLPGLPDTLAKAGIQTACITANAFLDNPAMIARFGEFHRANEPMSVFAERRREPERVTEQALTFLRDNRERRFFLYLHYMLPHEPYYPGPGYLGKFAQPNPDDLEPDAITIKAVKNFARPASPFQIADLRARYDEGLREVDDHVGKVIQALREQGIDGKTAIIVTADHGEAFWEHESLSHNSDVYNEMIQVPFIVHVPGQAWAEPVSPRVISTVDAFPSVCGLLGVSAPETLSGRPVWGVPQEPEAPQAYAGIYGTAMSPLEAFCWGALKLIRNPYSFELQVYNLASDPAEQINLAPARPVLALHLLARALHWKEGEETRWKNEGLPPDAFVAPEADYQKELEALGYF